MNARTVGECDVTLYDNIHRFLEKKIVSAAIAELMLKGIVAFYIENIDLLTTTVRYVTLQAILMHTW